MSNDNPQRTDFNSRENSNDASRRSDSVPSASNTHSLTFSRGSDKPTAVHENQTQVNTPESASASASANPNPTTTNHIKHAATTSTPHPSLQDRHLALRFQIRPAKDSTASIATGTTYTSTSASTSASVSTAQSSNDDPSGVFHIGRNSGAGAGAGAGKVKGKRKRTLRERFYDPSNEFNSGGDL